MTDRQRQFFYMPAWLRAQAKNWSIKRGLALPIDGRPENEMVRDVEAAAGVIADGLPCHPNYLRYAAHALARRNYQRWQEDRPVEEITLARHVIKSGELNQVELEQCVHVFRLCSDPEDMDSWLAWFQPESDQTKRIKWSLENKAVPGYVASLCRSKFGQDDWRQLSDPDLRELHLTLKNRPAAWRTESTTP